MSQAAGSRRVVVLDTETTSLKPDYWSGSGVIWELAALEPATGCERLWRMEPDVTLADPESLEVGRYAERTAGMRHATREDIAARYGATRPPLSRMTDVWDLAWDTGTPAPGFWSSPSDLAETVAWSVLNDVTLVCAVPGFDTGFLGAWLHHYGHSPQPWHYRTRDIGSVVWGYLRGRGLPCPPLDASTDVLAQAIGVDPAAYERHSALGDVRLIAAMLEVTRAGEKS